MVFELDRIVRFSEETSRLFRGREHVPVSRRGFLKAGALLGLTVTTPITGCTTEATPQGEVPSSEYIFTETGEIAYETLVRALDEKGMSGELAPTLMALTWKESRFDNERVNPNSGARGYMQIKPESALEVGYTVEDIAHPQKNLEIGASYFRLNMGRFDSREGIVGRVNDEDSSRNKYVAADPDEATNFALIAHNLGPGALSRTFDRGFANENAAGYIRDLEVRISRNLPIPWRSLVTGERNELTVEKMQEVVRFYTQIKEMESSFATKIQNYNQGWRREMLENMIEEQPEVTAPIFVEHKGEEALPITVIDDDTLFRLANDYTGMQTNEQVRLIREFNDLTSTNLQIGQTLLIPKSLLISDLQTEEYDTFYLDADRNSIFSIAQAYTRNEGNGIITRNTRIMQRSSKVTNPQDMDGTMPIYVPSTLLTDRVATPEPVVIPGETPPEPEPVPVPTGDFSIDRSKMRTAGNSRRPFDKYFNSRLLNVLKQEGEYDRNMAPRAIDTVIYHTTETDDSWQGTLNTISRRKSAHFFIAPNGQVYQTLDTELRANGTGKSMWNNLHGLDFNAINIEIYSNVEETPLKPITDAQYDSLNQLTQHLEGSHPITQHLGHNQVAVSYAWDLSSWMRNQPWRKFVSDLPRGYRQRKGDPGKDFQWDRVGLSNMYDLRDSDLISGRATNNLDTAIGKNRALPGQKRDARR